MSETKKDQEWTERQRAVLEHALDLLVHGGERALTTAGLARAANCSKESLYKWFNDRDGLLAAMVSFQASKVRSFSDRGDAMTRDEFLAHITGLGEDLLKVLTGEVSIALNRLAIGQVTREGSRLGDLLVAQGRRRIDSGAKALLQAGQRSGHISFEDGEETYRTFYGLVVRDSHVRLLLGEIAAQDIPIAAQVRHAVGQFFRLYGAEA